MVCVCVWCVCVCVCVCVFVSGLNLRVLSARRSTFHERREKFQERLRELLHPVLGSDEVHILE